MDINNINLAVSVYRTYGERRSAGFELRNPKSSEILFTIDVDVNRPITKTKIYEISGLQFRGVTPIQIMADKISVVSSDKVFRRIKDLIDLYYLSKVFVLNSEEIFNTLKENGRKLDSFDCFLNKKEELEHSYDKFRFLGDINKPAFNEIYNDVRNFVADIIASNNI